MLNHAAVIGAGFGDEGKGQTVDFLTNFFGIKRVVRFNGGSQAGHTVETPEGKRFVFSQLGSGSCVGASTHLSRFMYINPVRMLREIEAFEHEFGCTPPPITVSPMAKIMLPVDTRIGRTLHSMNGHGSVGHGVFAAVTRSYDPDRVLRYKDLKEWPCEKLVSFLRSVDAAPFVQKLVFELYEFLRYTTMLEDSEAVKVSCMFEGAQGLLLDKDSGFFPHVTPSNTGTKNIAELIGNTKSLLSVFYTTRTYLTRHGNGGMYLNARADGLEMPSHLPRDETNTENEWQGKMRYAPLSIMQLRNAIQKDWFELCEIATHARSVGPAQR